MPFFIDQIEFINDKKCLVLYNKSNHNFFTVDMDFPRNDNADKTSCSVKFNILRQFIQGSEEEKLSCFEFIKDEQYMAYNVNLVSLLSLQNSTRCLKQALSVGLP